MSEARIWGCLKPDRPVIWSSDAVAVFDDEEMYDMVPRTRVLRDDLVGLERREVLLKSGERVEYDAVVCNWEVELLSFLSK